MKCKLCKKSDDFGKSHVIPESFFLNEAIAGETPLLATNKQGVFPKKRPIGEYDTEILCKECEKRFGIWDNYAKVLLIDEIDGFQEISEGNNILGYSRETFDYDKIKLFFISVLWRAGVSKREYFTKVSLGPHEEILRKMILCQNPGSKDEYSVELLRFKGIDGGVPIIMPVRIRTKYGFQYYRIYLGRVFFDIKVDSRKTPKQYGIGEIEKGLPLIVGSRNIKDMDEYRILKEVVNAPHNATTI